MARSACVEHGMGADEARDDAAAIDVADEDRRHVRRAGEAEIGDVAGAQIGFGRRARALDEDEVGPGWQAARSCPAPAGRKSPRRAKSPEARWPATRPCRTIWLPVSLSGFSRTGFMSTCGAMRAARACSACARPISPLAVAAALFDMFCGLNGRDLQPAIGKEPAEPGHDQRLADIRAGAEDHDGGGASDAEPCACLGARSGAGKRMGQREEVGKGHRFTPYPATPKGRSHRRPPS